MKDVTLKQRELARLQVLNDILEYQVPTPQAAEILGVSERHTRRLLNAYRRDGAAALAHGNRGRRPHNAVLESEVAAVVRLASTKYAGTNHTHLAELLGEREGINLSRPTVRRILVKAGIGSPRSRRPQQHRVRRQRMPQEGMLVQVDGSHHRWLGEDGPRFALLLTVDDATGTVPAAVFCQEEDTPSYFLLMDRLVRRHGVPLAIYSDRRPVFKFTGDIDRYPAGPTQFARAMEELGVRQIFARSPQAKGRVERAAATFQDRLVTELRLAGAATITEADELLNDFLPRFNEKFGVQAEQGHCAYRRLEQSVSLDQILCFKHRRKVSRDNTIKYSRRTLQLLPGKTRPTYAGVQVEVQEDLEGRLLVQYQGRTIPTQEAPPRPGLVRAASVAHMEGSGVGHSANNAEGQWGACLARLETGEVDRDLRPRKSKAQQHRMPTARQRTLWENVQQARLRGLSLRAIARELGIHWNTARKYALANSPPLRSFSGTTGSPDDAMILSRPTGMPGHSSMGGSPLLA